MFHCVSVEKNVLFIHLSADGHLVGFHILATVNNAAMNIGIHIYIYIFWICGFFFPLEKYPEVELLDHMVPIYFNFLITLHTVFHSVCIR